MNDQGQDIIFHPYDDLTNINDEHPGIQYGERILEWGNTHNISIPDDAKMLGFGAGSANPEAALAKTLGIPPDRTTLVDFQYAQGLQPQGKGELIGERMEDYLKNPSQTDFSVISAYGMDHVLQNKATRDQFFDSLPQLLRPGGFVVIYPFVGSNSDADWKKRGFEPVVGNEGFATYAPLVYCYKPENLTK